MVAGVESFAGRLLWKFFNHRGFEVVPVRQRRSGMLESETIIDWDMIEEQGFPRCDFVVNCAHSDPFEELKNFTDFNKVKMEQGRLRAIKILANAIRTTDRKPMAFVNLGSAFFYPSSNRFEPYTEEFKLPETSDVNLSYFTRLEREMEKHTQVYDPDNDILPKHNPLHLDHEEFYRELEKSPARSKALIQQSRDAENREHEVQMSTSANIARGDANESFGKIRTHSNAIAAGLHAEQPYNADENQRFQHSAASLEINSNPITNAQVRVITARVGHILAPGSPLLMETETLRKWGMLGPLGSGTQFTPWIHELDFCELVLQALVDENYTTGPLNIVSPEATTNSQLMEALALASHSPLSSFNIGQWLIVKKYGPVVAQMLLNSYKVAPARALANKFKFRFPHADAAAMDVFERIRKHNHKNW